MQIFLHRYYSQFFKEEKKHRPAVIRDELAIFAETMEGFQRSRSGIIIPMSNFICGANGCYEKVSEALSEWKNLTILKPAHMFVSRGTT